MDISKARVQSHIDVINTCHVIIKDTEETRKRIEEYACQICFEKDQCKLKGRCKATSDTILQLNTLASLVVLHDSGAKSLELPEQNRLFTLNTILCVVNPILAEYLSDSDNMQFHALLCMSNNKQRV